MPNLKCPNCGIGIGFSSWCPKCGAIKFEVDKNNKAKQEM